MTLTFGSLFAGIGGMDLGLERAGMQCVWQVEIDDYCRRVLKKHWPDVWVHDDIKTFEPTTRHACDVVVGGFPCQDVSVNGKGAGLGGERSGLWFEMLRIVGQIKPRYVVIENVKGLLNRGLSRVLWDLASLGFDAEWTVLRCSQVGGRHRRARVFIVAYPQRHGLEGRRLFPQEAPIPSLDQVRHWPDVPGPFGIRSRHGVSGYVERIAALGNAVVPQVAEWIGRRIVEYHNDHC
jgi:DNA (cytosine-5)-methyltransferase 1